MKTKQEIERLFKIAAQIEKILQSKEASPYLSQAEIDKKNDVFENLLPLIKDIRTRRIVWLRSSGECWKTVCFNVNLSRWQAKRLYNEGIQEVLENFS